MDLTGGLKANQSPDVDKACARIIKQCNQIVLMARACRASISVGRTADMQNGLQKINEAAQALSTMCGKFNPTDANGGGVL